MCWQQTYICSQIGKQSQFRKWIANLHRDHHVIWNIIIIVLLVDLDNSYLVVYNIDI